LSALPAADWASAPGRSYVGVWGRHISGARSSVPFAHTKTKRPMRVIVGAVVFAVGILAGADIAAWLMPPA
jgi:hypothetical protein